MSCINLKLLVISLVLSKSKLAVRSANPKPLESNQMKFNSWRFRSILSLNSVVHEVTVQHMTVTNFQLNPGKLIFNTILSANAHSNLLRPTKGISLAIEHSATCSHGTDRISRNRGRSCRDLLANQRSIFVQSRVNCTQLLSHVQ